MVLTIEEVLRLHDEGRKVLKKEYHGHPMFYQLMQESMDLHSRKNKDYAQGGDPLGNFKRISAILKIWGYDIPPEILALIFMMKQLDASFWMSSHGYEGEVETFDTRMADVPVYSQLSRILKREGDIRKDDHLSCTNGKID